MKSNLLKTTTSSLPFNWYYDHKIFKQENDKIFKSEWIYVCHINSINKNQYRTLNLNNKNIVVIKNKLEEISIFYNTCLHRGSQIFNDQEGSIKAPVIICPYHQWSYDIKSGSLLNTTSLILDKFDKKKYALKKINFFIWKGLIFVNLKSNKKFNVKSIFQYYDSAIDKIDLENYSVGHVWKKNVLCNWKIYWENYSECLHCPNIHPELSKLVPLYQRRLVDIQDHPEWSILKKTYSHPKYHGGLKKGAQTWSLDGSSQGHTLDEVRAELESRGQVYISTWPTMFLGIYGDHIRIVRLIPISPEEVELTAEWLFPRSTLSDPQYNVNNVIDFGILVMNQDAKISEVNQRGVYNLENHSGVLMPEEYIIRNFHQYIKKKLKTKS
ncbi:aromatic ring-hydroxylating dioxygenase subunit alpha [Alphaproteobacteria bacterium]|nr:aromatic ring-hydroxylating dioxygenase subunit alpha [Alphaproteobacteria bacterium]